MIIEILIGAGVVALGGLAARAIARRRRAAKRAAETDKKNSDSEKEIDAAPRGLRIGDVLLYADTELWLAGAIELDEEGLVARLFPTPGAARSSWVAQLDDLAHDLAMLSPTEDVPSGAVPESLPIGGRRLSLERRGQANVKAEGEQLPRTTGRAEYAILSEVGGRVLIVVDFEKAPRLALHGERVSRGALDLLPGGDLDEGVGEAKKTERRKKK